MFSSNRSQQDLPSGFEAVSDVELQYVAGGLSWSGIWNAIKGAANWVVDHVFVDLTHWIIGYKGTF